MHMGGEGWGKGRDELMMAASSTESASKEKSLVRADNASQVHLKGCGNTVD